jgi:hypothetical protein
MVGVCLNSTARRLSTASNASSPVRISAEASATCNACAVSTTSFEVSP